MTLPDGIVVSYSYDQASELTGLTYALASNPLGNLAYGYDQDGRRIGFAGSWARTGIPNATTATASYNVANELTSWNGSTVAYDLNGNLTSDGTNTYTWDARNQLAGISGGVTASFSYDPFGRRLGKTIGSTTTNYLYDGLNPVQELLGTTVNANLLAGGLDEYFTRSDSVGTSNFLTDALGSTLALADTTGTVQTTYTYQPFGGTTTQGPAGANSYQFTGRENDGDGLYFYRARYYSPTYGRFISEDPAGFAGGINLHAYVGDSPTSAVDPLGLVAFAGPVTPSTAGRGCEDPKCFAQLKYRRVQDWRAELAFGRTHAFWYVQGSSGSQYIISGFPTGPGGAGSLNVGLNSNTTGGVDNTSAAVWWNSGLSPRNCKGVDAMIAAALGWPNNTIPYHPMVGPNSDTAAHILGAAGGFSPSVPPGTMGWSTPLPH